MFCSLLSLEFILDYALCMADHQVPPVRKYFYRLGDTPIMSMICSKHNIMMVQYIPLIPEGFLTFLKATNINYVCHMEATFYVQSSSLLPFVISSN